MSDCFRTDGALLGALSGRKLSLTSNLAICSLTRSLARAWTCRRVLHPALVGEGLQGIEAFHPDHDEKDEERALGVAGEFGLFVTGGSDFHGRYGAPSRLGERFVTPEEAGERVAELFSAEAGLR